MTGTFLYLTACSWRNRAVRRVQRLRQPRYVAGLAVGLVYLYFAVLRNQWRASRKGVDLFASPDVVSALPAVLALGALVLWLVVVVAWIWPSTEPPLKFSGAEVQFFFPAPVTRRQILHYRLLRSQVGVVFGVLIAALFSGAAMAAAAGRWTFLVGGLVMFSALRLHLLGVGLTRASFAASVSRPPLRAWVPPATMTVLSALFIAPLAANARELAALGLASGFSRFTALATTLPASIGIWPFTAVIAPILAPPGRPFLAALMPAVALLVLNYWWVLQSDAVLEDAAVAAEQQHAKGSRRLPAPVARRAPFSLGATGRPEFALLWKNLILLGRYASPRTLIRVLLPLVVLSVAVSTSKAGGAVTPLALMIAGFFTVFGPYMMRNDLRHDLPRLAILKTWPVRGWSLVVGEVLAPAAVLTVLAWTALAVALVLSRSLPWGHSSSTERLFMALVAGLIAPALICGQLLIQNAAVILFPGWIPTGGSRPRGIEAMGQQVLMLAGTLFALIVGILPAAAVAGLLGFVLYGFVGVAGILPAGLLFVAVLLVEAFVVVVLIGHVLERTEPLNVEAEE